MKSEILYGGSFAALKVYLEQMESIKAESGAMVTMSPACDVDGKLEGGILGGIGRMFAGESFFFQTIKATRGAGEAMLAPTTLGDITELELNGSYGLLVQKGSFLAASESVVIDTKIQNLAKGIFSGEGFFIIGMRGSGKVFLSSYGAIHPITLADGQEIIVDNGHMVAWPDYMNYRIEKASQQGWISSITSGEGLVCRFRGPGTIYIQTRNLSGFISWIRGVIPRSG